LNEVEGWLWTKAVAATRRYYRTFPKPVGELAKAQRIVEESIYRTGWLMGYRAGVRGRQ